MRAGPLTSPGCPGPRPTPLVPDWPWTRCPPPRVHVPLAGVGVVTRPGPGVAQVGPPHVPGAAPAVVVRRVEGTPEARVPDGRDGRTCDAIGDVYPDRGRATTGRRGETVRDLYMSPKRHQHLPG